MLSNRVELLYDKQKNLWRQKKDIEIRLNQIVRLREDIQMQKSIIQSDLLQEVGFSKDEFDAKHEKIFLQEAKLDDEEHSLGYMLNEIDLLLADIFLDVSQEFYKKVA